MKEGEFDIPGSGVAPVWLNDRLTSPQGQRGIILLDCRTARQYEISHIQGAIHVTIPSLLLRRLQKGNLHVCSLIQNPAEKEQFNSRCRLDTIVIYDDGSSTNSTPDNASATPDSLSSSFPGTGGFAGPTERFPSSLPCSPGPASGSSVASLLAKRLREDGCDVHILAGGYQAVQEQFQELCVSGQANAAESSIMGLRNLHIACTPSSEDSCSSDGSTIIPSAGLSPSAGSVDEGFPVMVLPYLYLGNADNSADLECLFKYGIKYILNVTHDVANTFEGQQDFRYMQIPIKDHWSQNLSVFFPDAIEFVDEAREKKCGVLVHCLAGISRSVTVTVAYLMQHRNLSLNDAYDFVKKAKPNISPNFNFMGQLKDFETMLNTSRGCRCQETGDKKTVCECKKTYFSSPMSTGSLSSVSSSAPTTSSSSASTFDYEVPPTPS